MNETAVAEEILKLYSQLPLNGKPSQKQYTVLSGIVGVISSTSHLPDHRYLPLCLCTGTKCLSNHDSAYQQGVTLSDSHAEILARRSLIRYLILSAIEVLKSPEYASKDNCPLRLHQTTDSQQEFMLKPEWSFWLYISDSPCGDASVYQRTSLERCFTGKKSQQCDDGAFLSSDRDPHALSSLLRCKPGRVDLKGTQRASSMSCSDKICRWNCLGLQGALLSKFITPPIFLSGIVISRDMASMEEEGQEVAVHRAISHRLELSFPHGQDQRLLQPAIPQISFCSLQFESGKCHMETQQYSLPAADPPQLPEGCPSGTQESGENSQPTSPLLSKRKRKAKALLEQNPCSELKSCSTNINWIRTVGSSPVDSKKKNCQGGTVEITLANTGRPQGTTKSSALKSHLPMESRLCRRAIGTLCLQLESLLQQSRPQDRSKGEGEQLLYGEYKRSGNERYLHRRELFLAHDSFKNWIVDDPQVSEMFLLSPH